MAADDIPQLAAAGVFSRCLGASYMLLLALGRARDLAVLPRASLLAYAGVVPAAIALCWALNPQELWLVLVVIVLDGPGHQGLGDVLREAIAARKEKPTQSQHEPERRTGATCG